MSPPLFVQTNRKHCIVQKINTISQGYGGCYQSKVWILQKMDTCNGQPTALYISYSDNNSNANANNHHFENQIEWKLIAGDAPVPRVKNGMMANTKQSQGIGMKRRNHCKLKRTFDAMNDDDSKMNLDE